MDESSPTNLLLEKWGADPPFQLIELGAIKMSFIRVLQLDIGYNLITDPRKIGLVELRYSYFPHRQTNLACLDSPEILE